VPKGSTIMVSPYVLHHTAANFPYPETFDPERFAPEREKQLPRYAYLPFGAGPRICIGNHLALMEGQMLMATLAQRVHFTLVSGQTIVPDPRHNLTLRPGGTVKVVVKKRDRGTDGNRRVSVSLSPTLTLFASPYGNLYLKMQLVLLRTNPLEIAPRRPGPKKPEYGIPASEWRNAVSHILENRDTF